MHRREFVRGGGAIAALSVAGCVGGADGSGSDGGSSGGWAYDETVTSDDGDIHEAAIGELEEGDEVEAEVVVNQGRHTRFELLNRDTGEFSEPAFVYRDSRIDGYDSEAEDHAVSPFRETYTISEFGEYYARVTLLASGLEVELRFREV